MNEISPPLLNMMPSDQTLEEAAEWFALLCSEEATASDRAHWQAWIDSEASHKQAWQYVEQISGRFQPVQTSADRYTAITVLNDASATFKKRRQVLFGLSVVMGSGMLGWSAWRYTVLPGTVMAWAADYRTGKAEIRDITLSDGTHVWLNTESALNADYNQHERRVHIIRGEILIQTAPDSLRPFLVDTPQGRLRALGTRFTVQLHEGRTFLAVYEGAVEVSAGKTGVTSVITAGQQVNFTDTVIDQPDQASPAREAWTRGVLIARNTPLGEVVQELQRYHTGQLSLSPDIAALPVFGSYPLDDTEYALEMLASVMPIRIRRTLFWWTSISARQ